MSDVGTALAGAAALLLIVIALAVVWAVFRANANKSEIELMVAANAELRSQIDDKTREIAELRGQVKAMQGTFAQDLAASLRAELVAAVTEMRKSP